jgi:tRNA modification GTPase
MHDQATICAIATPPGMGAIAVIRLSGIDAVAICNKVFTTPGYKELHKQQPYTISYGTIHDEGKPLDDVLVSLFKAPHSYTGEDAVEISCHGSLFIQQQILQLLLKNGARLANRGEFTQRAFINGKIDLSQAEAVADLISSSSESAHHNALQQMRGGFSGTIKDLRDKLVRFTSLIELELDFGEEDVEFADRKQLTNLIGLIESTITGLLQSFNLGNVIKNGVPVAIVGKTNVGKSTLLNTLLQEDRAIISEIEGTTRDTIEDVINIKGFLFRFIDTAGLRATNEQVEQMGIERTYQKINTASIVLLMVDAKDAIRDINNSILSIKEKMANPYTQLIVLINKIDQIKFKEQQTKLKKEHFSKLEKHDKLLGVSAKEHINIEELNNELLNSINKEDFEHNDVIVTNTRHYDALRRANAAVQRIKNGLAEEIPGDLLAQDIRECLHHLGEITGEVTTDEVLENIFRNFCIGK